MFQSDSQLSEKVVGMSVKKSVIYRSSDDLKDGLRQEEKAYWYPEQVIILDSLDEVNGFTGTFVLTTLVVYTR